MLVLMCHAGENRYAIDSADVIEVVTLVNFDTLADGPDWLTGVFAHRGVATPLVDFTLLLTGRPCPRRWNSRILLVQFEAEEMPERIGLLAERVTTAEIDDQKPLQRVPGRDVLMEDMVEQRALGLVHHPHFAVTGVFCRLSQGLTEVLASLARHAEDDFSTCGIEVKSLTSGLLKHGVQEIASVPSGLYRRDDIRLEVGP